MSVREFLCPPPEEYIREECGTIDMAGTVIAMGFAAILVIIVIAMLVYLVGGIHDWVVDRYGAEDETPTP